MSRASRIAAAALVTALALPSAAAPDTYVGEDFLFKRATIARLLAPAAARAEPGSGAVLYRFGDRARWNGGPIGLRVTGTTRTAAGRRYLRVLLPRRPNGIEGWVPADRARVGVTPWRVVIDRSARTLSLRRKSETVRSWRIVIGAPETPTPTGRFAVDERVRQPDADGFLGPWILHLTAFSDVLDDFGGGPGRVGIHGRGGASLNDPLGSAASHGCLRMDNAAVSFLSRRAREGTPVRIRE